jgi:hypothetical protein
LLATITRQSLAALKLHPGQTVHAQIKAVALTDDSLELVRNLPLTWKDICIPRSKSANMQALNLSKDHSSGEEIQAAFDRITKT